MSFKNRVQQFLRDVSFVEEKYSEIKENLSKLFILNAQDEVDLQYLIDIADKYTLWQQFVFNKIDEFQAFEEKTEQFYNRSLKKELNKIKGEITPEQRKRIKSLMNIKEKVDREVYKSMMFWEEIAILWAIANKEMPIVANEPLPNLDNASKFQIVFSGSIHNLFYQFICYDKFEKIGLNSALEASFEKGLKVESANAPVVLIGYEINELKRFANILGLKIELAEWTPQNCNKLLFDYGKPETPFKELDGEIKLL